MKLICFYTTFSLDKLFLTPETRVTSVFIIKSEKFGNNTVFSTGLIFFSYMITSNINDSESYGSPVLFCIIISFFLCYQTGSFKFHRKQNTHGKIFYIHSDVLVIMQFLSIAYNIGMFEVNLTITKLCIWCTHTHIYSTEAILELVRVYFR